MRVPVPPGSAPDRNVVVADPRIRRFISARYSDLNTEAGEIEKYDLFVVGYRTNLPFAASGCRRTRAQPLSLVSVSSVVSLVVVVFFVVCVVCVFEDQVEV